LPASLALLALLALPALPALLALPARAWSSWFGSLEQAPDFGLIVDWRGLDCRLEGLIVDGRA
jgi:hypothetical protein